MDSFESRMNPRFLAESEKGMLWEPRVTESGRGTVEGFKEDEKGKRRSVLSSFSLSWFSVIHVFMSSVPMLYNGLYLFSEVKISHSCCYVCYQIWYCTDHTSPETSRLCTFEFSIRISVIDNMLDPAPPPPPPHPRPFHLPLSFFFCSFVLLSFLWVCVPLCVCVWGGGGIRRKCPLSWLYECTKYNGSNLKTKNKQQTSFTKHLQKQTKHQTKTKTDKNTQTNKTKTWHASRTKSTKITISKHFSSLGNQHKLLV